MVTTGLNSLLAINMDKSKIILREGYVYKHENGKDEVLYCVLKVAALCFHRRKVHKRHTPLGMLKLETFRVEVEECKEEEMTKDCNSNNNRFPWRIVTQDFELFLHCGSENERTEWLGAIRKAQQDNSLSTESSRPVVRSELEDVSSPVSARASEETKDSEDEKQKDSSPLEIPGGFVADSPSSDSVYNSSHTDADKEDGVGINEDLMASIDDKPRHRLRSHSLSEIVCSPKITESDEFAFRRKSNTAPLDGGHGRKAFKTVDKLIDVHSTFCRQLVRWI